MSQDEYDELMRQAEEAYANGDMWTAGLLFERGHQLASDLGNKQEAFYAVRWAAESWMYSADPDRGIRLFLEAGQQLESLVDPQDQYWLHTLFITLAMVEDVAVVDLDQQMARMSELAIRGWGTEGSRTHILTSMWAGYRGQWETALEAAERAWAQKEEQGPGGYAAHIASSAVQWCLRLGRRNEAERWYQLTCATGEGTVTRLAAAECRANLTQFDNDAPAARSASRQLDALANPEQPADIMIAAEAAIYAVLLDAEEGDPSHPGHLIRLRLTHQPLPAELRFWFRHSWHSALACLELAGVRYAAGMQPVDDCYYATPQTLPHPDDARLPDEILPRLATFDRACDTALDHAIEADTRFNCSWRQQDIADLRQRGREIAAVFRR